MPTPKSSATCLRVSPLVNAMRTASLRNSSLRFSPIARLLCCSKLDFPDIVADYDNRATRLALAALQTDRFEQATASVRKRWGADRCGIVLGTSSSGVETLESLYRSLPSETALPVTYSVDHHDSQHAVTAFLQSYLGFDGPSYSVSTACSSSAKALVDAYQLIAAGICDAVLTGGWTVFASRR